MSSADPFQIPTPEPGMRGRILKVKIGVNPNSSSLGTDLQVILFGATALGLLTTFLSTAIRIWRKPKVQPETGKQDGK
ncbi:MAG: hypothetical protein P9M14_06735 [Candidatus Alcyoniella australis]|nr:hypothetical protein [Candidatus Alcyoniella australis]